MTVRNMNAYSKSHWDWSMFNDCFDNSRITLTDLDGALERNGYLLILETKGLAAYVSGGQRIAFYHLCKTGTTSIIVVWGQPQQPVACQFFHLGQVHIPQPCDYDFLRKAVRQWYEWASSQPPAWTLNQTKPRKSS